MTGATKILKVLGRTISKNSPTILTGMAVTGLITTTILAVRATPRAMQLLEQEQAETPREMIETCWRCYLPAVAVGAVTVACIIGANHINLRRNAAIASLYSLTDAAFSEYKAKVVETIGKNKEEKLRNEIVDAKITKEGDRQIIFTGKGDHLCYDAFSGRYFKSNIETIRRTINQINYDLMTDMFIPLNDVYEALGLEGIGLGKELGFDVDKGLLEVTFSSHLTADNVPCLVLTFPVTPQYSS